jgi:hypothetical protein
MSKANATAVRATYEPGIGWRYVDAWGRHGNYETEAQALEAGRERHAKDASLKAIKDAMRQACAR